MLITTIIRHNEQLFLLMYSTRTVIMMLSATC